MTPATSAEILERMRDLSAAERLRIVEITLQQLRQDLQGPNRGQGLESALKQAAEALLGDYSTDSELTAFTSLDSEPFHAQG